MHLSTQNARSLLVLTLSVVVATGCAKPERLAQPHEEEDADLLDSATRDLVTDSELELDLDVDESTGEIDLAGGDEEVTEVPCTGPREQIVDDECVCDPDYHRDRATGECLRCLNNSHCGNHVCVANTCRPCIHSDECGERHCNQAGQCQDRAEACESEGDTRCSRHLIQNCEDGYWWTDDEVCPFGCDTETMECYPDTNIGWIGGRCDTVADCTSLSSSTAECLQDDEGFLDGYCSQPCTSVCPSPGSAAHSATFCIDSRGLNEAGFCTNRCNYEAYTDTGCRTGYECRVTAKYKAPRDLDFICLPVNWWRNPTRSFDHGIASGEIQSTSAVVWAHTGSAESDVVVEYGENRDRLERRLAARRTTSTEDFTVQANLPGLAPATEYFYRFVLDDGLATSPVGSFRTAPMPDANIPVSFVFSGDVSYKDWENDIWLVADPFDIFRFMDETEPDFFISLGGWPDATAASVPSGYHSAYRLTRDREQIWDFLRDTPLYALLDDDEVHDDWDPEYAAANPTEVAYGLEVWGQWFPFHEQIEGERYRRYRWGSLEFFLLDTRTHRDSQIKFDDYRKTMLGEAQLEWLLTGLRNSEALFKFVVTSVPLDLSTNEGDSWTGYTYERDLIVDHILCPRSSEVEDCEDPIEGVVFLSSDQLWFGAKHYDTGLKEFQTGPLTRTPAPTMQAENAIAVANNFNFGRFEYDPVDGGRLTIEVWEVENRIPRAERTSLIYREVIRPGHGRIEVTSDPEFPAKFRICEPTDIISCAGAEPESCAHTFFGVAPTTYEYASPGPYRIHWYPSGGYVTPEPEDLCLDSGGTISFHGEFVDAPLPWHDDFEVRSGWLVVDEGETAAPSRWIWADGQLLQQSNIYDNIDDDADLAKLGTLVWTGNQNWAGYTVSVSFFSRDDDGVGLLARYQDSEHYYRFSLDSQRSFVRLVKRDGDEFTALAVDEDFLPYVVEEWTDFSLRVSGDTIEGLIDGEVVLTATDTAYATGSVGIYSWGSDRLVFDDLHVE